MEIPEIARARRIWRSVGGTSGLGTVTRYGRVSSIDERANQMTIGLEPSPLTAFDGRDPEPTGILGRRVSR